MTVKKTKIVNRLGIHGRVANSFVHVASQFDSHVCVERADDPMKKANANSIVFVLALCLNQGNEIIISAEGPDEEKAVDTLVQFIEELPVEQ